MTLLEFRNNLDKFLRENPESKNMKIFDYNLDELSGNICIDNVCMGDTANPNSEYEDVVIIE